MADKTVVLVDDREPDSAVPRLREYGLLALSSRLESADYESYPHGLKCLIERKTMSNLLTSMSDRQLVSQAHRMVESSDLCFLLREGAFRRSPQAVLEYYSPRDPRADGEGWVQSGWAWDSFQGIMIDIQMMGVKMLDCPVLGEYPMEIARVLVNLHKEEHRWIKERQRPDVVFLDKEYRNVLWALSAFDGIGPEISEALLYKFGTVYEVIRAAAETPELIAQVRVGKRSIGPRLSKRFQQEVLSQWATLDSRVGSLGVRLNA